VIPALFINRFSFERDGRVVQDSIFIYIQVCVVGGIKKITSKVVEKKFIFEDKNYNIY